MEIANIYCKNLELVFQSYDAPNKVVNWDVKLFIADIESNSTKFVSPMLDDFNNISRHFARSL